MKSTLKNLSLFSTTWDERQQQGYRRINSKAYNTSWFLLLLSIIVLVMLYPDKPLRWAAEIVLFLILTTYGHMLHPRRALDKG